MDEIRAREAFESALKTYKQDFGSFFLARLYGLDIRYEGDTCIIDFDIQDYMFNPQGTLHGGIMAFVMDVSMGHLLNHAGGPGTTLEMKVQFTRAVRAGRVRVIGEFVKRGKEICFLRSNAYDSERKLVAFATSTWKLM